MKFVWKQDGIYFIADLGTNLCITYVPIFRETGICIPQPVTVFLPHQTILRISGDWRKRLSACETTKDSINCFLEIALNNRITIFNKDLFLQALGETLPNAQDIATKIEKNIYDFEHRNEQTNTTRSGEKHG